MDSEWGFPDAVFLHRTMRGWVFNVAGTAGFLGKSFHVRLETDDCPMIRAPATATTHLRYGMGMPVNKLPPPADPVQVKGFVLNSIQAGRKSFA